MSDIQLAERVFYKVGDDWELGFPVEKKEVNGKFAYGIINRIGGETYWCYEDNVKPVSSTN